MFAFLMCSERSGSNLLTSLMGAHSRVCAPPPSHLFRLFVGNRGNYGDLSNDENWHNLLQDFADNYASKLGHWNTFLDQRELAATARRRSLLELLEAVYAAEAAYEGADHLFVKENHTYRIAPFLLSHRTDCRFVFMVRDPRDVAASWISTHALPGGVEGAVNCWVEDQRHSINLFDQMRDSGRMLLIRYEDLTADVRLVLTSITRFLGLDYEEDMLDFHKQERTVINARRLAAWENLAKPVMTSNFGAFRNKLTAEDVEYVELRAGTLMAAFGYQREYPECRGETEGPARLEYLRQRLSVGSEGVSDRHERAIREKRLAAIDRVLSRRPAEGLGRGF